MIRNTNILICLLFLILANSCKKEHAPTNQQNNIVQNQIGELPSSFIKNILIENFTGEWNPNCPIGDDSLKAMKQIDSNRVIIASIHQGDWLMLNLFYNSISTHLGGVNGFPRATIDRMPALQGSQIDSTVISIFNWRQNINNLLLQPITNCGLAMITSEKNDVLNINLYIGFTDSIQADTRLTLYLVEDSILAQNQMNAINPYFHHQVLRKVITSNLGDSISMLQKPLLIKNYETNISTVYKNKNNIKVIAILHQVGQNSKDHSVLNCQQARLNDIKNWNSN